MKLSRTYNLSNNTFSEGYKCDLPLPEKIVVMRALRAAQEEIRKIDREFYALEDAGVDAMALRKATYSKYWKVHTRRGYEIHEFIGA